MNLWINKLFSNHSIAGNILFYNLQRGRQYAFLCMNPTEPQLFKCLLKNRSQLLNAIPFRNAKRNRKSNVSEKLLWKGCDFLLKIQPRATLSLQFVFFLFISRVQRKTNTYRRQVICTCWYIPTYCGSANLKSETRNVIPISAVQDNDPTA